MRGQNKVYSGVNPFTRNANKFYFQTYFSRASAI